ncbi:MAG TPA: hypothetical protein VML55_26150 [Planctomycetaceae bacterium]|nr:hypothetical protein [Planctomycetaceae bacterium]
MPIPPDWKNPIHVRPGATQTHVDPALLLPSRPDLWRTRLEAQRQLLLAGIRRITPILVTSDGIIYDGHHAVRAAAEESRTVDVQVTDATAASVGLTILELPVR